MNYEIGNPEMAWLLAAVPVVVLLCVRSAWLNRRCRRQFGGPERQARGLANFVSTTLLTSGVALLALACMDIRWGKTTREVPQRGLEVVFALDVSRSMLAQDAKPNRLSRAKQQIKDMLAEMAGDRVGLVIFAGEAKQAVPLTNHYHDFQQKLDTVGPDSVSVGGSQLGVAIKAASKAFLSKTNDHKTIVLFTDGEDQESKPVELTKQLHEENGLRIFTVGLGDITQGSRIPDDVGVQGRRGDRFLQHNGQQVWSKLNGNILKRIATESEAAYIPAGTKRVNMAEVYHRYIANVEKSEFETAKINAFVPRFQWFAFPAFVCLWLHVWLSGALAKREVASASKRIVAPPRRRNVSKVAQAALLMCMCLPTVASGQTTDQRGQTIADQINAANELVRENKATEAIEAYNAIEDSNAEHQDALNYNLANAHYRNADIDAALALFSEAAASSNTQIASNSRYNLGNCRYAKALPLVQENHEAAIAELQQATQHFRSALRLDRSLSDARENLERATKLIQQLKQQLEEQQQQNEDQQSQDNDQEGQKSNEDQKSNKETDSQQQQKSDQTESQDKQESDRGDQSQDDGSSQEEQSDSQSSAKADGENADQTSDQQDSGPQGEQSDAEDGSNSESDSMQGKQNETGSQRDAENSPTSKQESGASEDESQNASGDEDESKNKQPPTGELSSVNPSASEDSPEQENASGTVAQQPGSENGTMTRQEALKLLQAVRDRDMIRRYRQRQRQRQQRVPVEKDW
jgi:Ca-activated chloride channel family protein